MPTIGLRTGTPSKKIGIMGPFGGGNLGDAAIQQTMIEHIRAYHPDAQIYGFSLIPGDTERRHGIPSFPIGRVTEIAEAAENRAGRHEKLVRRLRASSSPALSSLARWLVRAPLEWALIRDAYRNLRGLDYLIVSGGGQLDDYWGGAWSHPYTLLKYGLLARLRRARLMFVSVGAGPIDRRLSRWFIKAALALAAYRSYRDEDSRRLIESIGFRRGDPVYPDLAHSLAVAPYLRPQAPAARPLVAVGPMAYFDPRIWPQRDQQVYAGYLAKLAEFSAWLLRGGHDLLLFTGEADHDRRAVEDLQRLLAAHGVAGGRVHAPPIETVDDLLAQLAAADLVVASRFHGVLLAQLLNKPVLALSYHQKIDVLMADTGQADYCLPIDRFDLDALKQRFGALAAARPAIEAQLSVRTQRYREALDEQYRNLFNGR